MALTKVASLLLVVVVGVTSTATGSIRGTRGETAVYFPQIDCSQAPTATSTSSNGTAFNHNLPALLASLPDQAAPTGFASTAAGGDDRAFARAVCVGDSTPAQCHACLTAAVMDVVATCGRASRRAGAWLDGCYLAYADTNTTSPSEKVFHRWFVTGEILPFRDNVYPTFLDLSNGVAQLAGNRARSGRMMATQAIDNAATGLAGRVLAQCAADRAPADCVQCMQDSARAMPRCCWDVQDGAESVAIVLSYDCVLQFNMYLASSSPSASSICGTLNLFAFAVGVALALIM